MEHACLRRTPLGLSPLSQQSFRNPPGRFSQYVMFSSLTGNTSQAFVHGHSLPNLQMKKSSKEIYDRSVLVFCIYILSWSEIRWKAFYTKWGHNFFTSLYYLKCHIYLSDEDGSVTNSLSICLWCTKSFDMPGNATVRLKITHTDFRHPVC